MKSVKGGQGMIAIGSDHGGYDLKELVMKHLDSKNISYHDVGCYNKESCDYPTYGKEVAKAVLSGECEKGIVICTTGIGISITVNRFKGIRAALCADTLSAKLTRLHNNANVLAMGAGIIGPDLAISIVDTFLETEFSEIERHERRVNAIENE